MNPAEQSEPQGRIAAIDAILLNLPSISLAEDDEYARIIEGLRHLLHENTTNIFSWAFFLLHTCEFYEDTAVNLVADLACPTLFECFARVPIFQDFPLSAEIMLEDVKKLMNAEETNYGVQLQAIYLVLTTEYDTTVMHNVAISLFDRWCIALRVIMGKEWRYHFGLVNSINWEIIGGIIGQISPPEEAKDEGDNFTNGWQQLVRHLTNFQHFTPLMQIFSSVRHPWCRSLFIKTMMSALEVQNFQQGYSQKITLNTTEGVVIEDVEISSLEKFLKTNEDWQESDLFEALMAECVPKSPVFLMRREMGRGYNWDKNKKRLMDLCKRFMVPSRKRLREE